MTILRASLQSPLRSPLRSVFGDEGTGPPPVGVWTEVYSTTITAGETGWAGYTLVNTISLAEFSQTGGTKIRLTLTASSASGSIIANFFIGEQGGLYNYTPNGPMTRITWDGGNNGLSLNAGESIVSDEIDYTKDAVNAMVMDMDLDPGLGYLGHQGTNAVAPNYVHYQNGQFAGEVNKSAGYANYPGNGFYMIRKIELLI